MIPQDATQFTWFLAWVPYALAHGMDPLFSNAIFSPTGVNLAQNTAAPLLGFLTAPLALVMGPIARANAVAILAMPISATAAFVVLRWWKVWGPAAAIGGLAMGSTFAVGESLSHPFLVFCPFPPFIAYTVAVHPERRGSPVRLGVATGLLLAGQYLCSQEIFTTVVLLIGWALFYLAIRDPRKVISVARACWRGFAVAFGVMVVVLAYPVWMLQFGPQRYVGTAQMVVNPFHNDVFSFVAPGPLQKVGLGLRGLVTLTPDRGVVGYPSELGGYIGIGRPGPGNHIRLALSPQPAHAVTLAVLLGAAFLLLGPRLGSAVTLLDSPSLRVADPFPFVKNLLASRFSLEVAPAWRRCSHSDVDATSGGRQAARQDEPPANVRSDFVWDWSPSQSWW